MNRKDLVEGMTAVLRANGKMIEGTKFRNWAKGNTTEILPDGSEGTLLNTPRPDEETFTFSVKLASGDRAKWRVILEEIEDFTPEPLPEMSSQERDVITTLRKSPHALNALEIREVQNTLTQADVLEACKSLVNKKLLVVNNDDAKEAEKYRRLSTARSRRKQLDEVLNITLATPTPPAIIIPHAAERAWLPDEPEPIEPIDFDEGMP